MATRDFTELPFFAPEHRDLRKRAATIAKGATCLIDHHDIDSSCRTLVKAFAREGLLKLSLPETRYDVISLCLIRESMAYEDGLADFAFAMQGLGSGPIVLFGSEDQKRRWLPQVASGDALAAFAISEPEAGSDVAALACAATPDGNEHFCISGEKTWISNGGIADHYVVFCRTGEQAGARGLSAFIVAGSNPGLEIAERIETIAPHPLARLKFNDCRVSVADRLGAGGAGFKIAMSTLDIFRSTVGAAALGMARRAFDEAVSYSASRRMFGSTLSVLQLTQARLADMLVDIDSAALLVYRAAWTKDNGAERITREFAMAKLAATEAAQRVIDGAVQLHGGLGVKSGVKVEQLYREIRALRIYEGASEVQKLVIARDILAEHSPR